jgi:hypothetical protein
MEAVFFRFLARELAAALVGARVEKIYLPSPNCLTLALFTVKPLVLEGVPRHTCHLHVRYGSGRFFCFCSPLKTRQPLQPPAEAMRLRKHLRGRRLERLVADWPARRLLLVAAGQGPALLLDPRAAPALIEAPPEQAPSPPVWPPLETVLGDPDLWRTHPQFSPELRRRLAAMPREAARTALDRLAAGEPDGFFVEYRGDMPTAVWPLSVFVKEDGAGRTRRFDSALEAAAAFGQPLAFAEVSGRWAAPEAAAQASGRRRLARALARLDVDEARMRGFIARRTEADALAANLHRLDPRAKLALVTLEAAEGQAGTLVLDPALTVVQNMQKFYHLAAKGERGLTAIAARRRDLQDEKKALIGRERSAGRARPGSAPAGGAKGVAAHAYRTTDGFLALRGRNAKANDQLLRQANAFDLWFHVANGPGAHVILRRDHPGREVPRRSLLEAAGLAALASYAAKAGSAEVLVARVGDVRRIKGAAAGRVSVDAVLETVRAPVSPELEMLRETP